MPLSDRSLRDFGVTQRGQRAGHGPGGVVGSSGFGRCRRLRRRLGLQNGQGVGDGTSAGRAGRGENFIIAHGGS